MPRVRTRKTPAHILEQLRADYAANPERRKEKVRKAREYRRAEEDRLNARRRQQAAERRAQAQAAKWATYQQNPPDESLSPGKQLRLWLDAKGWSVVELAGRVSVNRRSVFDWLRDKHPPVGRKRRQLYEVMGLECFRVRAREKRPPQAAEAMAAELLKQFVVRCGLSTREIRSLKRNHVEENGIRLPSGRLIAFGNGWEQVSREAVESWVASAKPAGYLFFKYKPVDRSQPADRLWIVRRLRAGGIRTRRSQTTRIRHFAGDFVRLNSEQEFRRHLRERHDLSRSGAYSVSQELRKRQALLSTDVSAAPNLTPQTAFDALYPRRRTAGGAPRGLRHKTKLRIDLAAAGELMRKSVKETCADMRFEGTATDQQRRTYEFYSEYRTEIDSRTKEIHAERASDMYEAAKRSLSRRLPSN